MIIDVHTHVFPDNVAFEAVPKMAEIAGVKEALDGRLQSLQASMNIAGIDQCWLQPVATKPKQVDSINAWSKEIRSDSILSFGAFHPEYENLPDLISRLSQEGFPGIKFHPEYHKITPDDSRFDPLYEALINENMIVLFHAGVDIGIPTINSTPNRFIRLSNRFPQLKMILAHMGGFQQWQEVMAALEEFQGKEIYLDTSYVFGYITPDEFLAIVEGHGEDRILFGTDSPWSDQHWSLKQLHALSLTQDQVDKITGLNAQRLLETTGKSKPPTL